MIHLFLFLSILRGTKDVSCYSKFFRCDNDNYESLNESATIYKVISLCRLTLHIFNFSGY